MFVAPGLNRRHQDFQAPPALSGQPILPRFTIDTTGITGLRMRGMAPERGRAGRPWVSTGSPIGLETRAWSVAFDAECQETSMPEIAKSKKGHWPAGLSGDDRLYLR